MILYVGYRLIPEKALEECGAEIQICAVGVIFARIPQRLGSCLCVCLPIGQHIPDFAKCGVREQSLTGRKASEVGGREALLGHQKNGWQTTGGGDSKYAAEYADDDGRPAQIVLQRPRGM
jgi:hypothetical protein